VYDNDLSGSIPATVGNWEDMMQFHANGNKLTGSIPATVGNWEKLMAFTVHQNQLSGGVLPPLPFDKMSYPNCQLFGHPRRNAFYCPWPQGATEKCAENNGSRLIPITGSGCLEPTPPTPPCATTHHNGTAASMIEVPWDDALAGDFNLTVEILLGLMSSTHSILSRTKTISATNAGTQFDLQVHTGVSLNYFMGNGQPSLHQGYGVQLLGPNLKPLSSKWTTIKLTMIGETCTMFVNGKQVSSLPFVGTRLNTTKPIHIGGYFNNPDQDNQYYNGSLRNAKINGKCLLEQPPPPPTPHPTPMLPTPLPSPAPGTSPCTGLSVNLVVDQCLAWIEVFETLDGDGWTNCKGTRLDPCSCKAAPPHPAEIICGGGNPATVAVM
jgi:hypothetical protein